jgi:uncharacterized membrane protein
MLTDAIFAVAMTILILEIKIPEGLSAVGLPHYFLDTLIPNLLFYCISFIILGIFWIGSHFHHHFIKETDRMSSWLNIFFLMTICVIPLSAKFISEYRHEKLSIIFYAVNLILTSLCNYLMIVYAWRRNYIKPLYTTLHFNDAKRRILLPVYIYAAIIPVAFISTTLAKYLFLLPVILHLLPEKANSSINE